jgi:hypothetical protein
MKVKTAYSQKTDIKSIIAEIKEQIGSFEAKLVQFYASPGISPREISKEIHKLFGGIPTIGCSSSGEIITGQMLDNSIVLMAMGAEIVSDCHIEVLNDIDANQHVVDKSFDSFTKHYGKKMSDLDPQKYVGLVLIDGLSGKEEAINERIGDLTNITFIGGSAGDNLQFKRTYLYANGKSYTNAAILALIKSNTKFDIIKTQSFKSIGKKLKVTKANEEKRTIIEFNNRPALDEYTDLLDVKSDNLSSVFASNPIGMVFEDDFFVRSPQKADGKNMVFYCSIKEGMSLDILEATDIIDDTRVALQSKIQDNNAYSAIINFNCILRTLELKEKNQTQAYGNLFKNTPTIGFSTYGESYIGHINQTATMLLFK